MSRQLRSEDLGFLARAPVRRTRVRDLDAPADVVFEQLAAHPENWPRWFGPANECLYEGPPPTAWARRAACVCTGWSGPARS